MSSTDSLVRELHGPVLVLGASGFIGANLMRTLLASRSDVFGTASRDPAWRLADIDAERVITVDLLARGNLRTLLDRVQPATVFDCVAYGAYSFEQDIERMYQTNVLFKQELIEELLRARNPLLHPRGQLVGIRGTLRGARGEPGTGAQQPLCGDQERGRRDSSISRASIGGCAARTCGSTPCTDRSRIARA